MYLKNISLRGFKSFANKSNMIFEPGISVIVGPNGSGKSNIVDAIAWVLGEQSPKTLRGSSMVDVIFRSKKEELAIAEVSLTFDNSDKTLPLDFSDVKFTRRVYFKGGSDYYINSSPCRLSDIQDMISDGGIGKGLYTIVSQGQINNIAVLKPEERKQIIDETIGLSKHKNRRTKARNNLDKVSDDINRIGDLLAEVKRTMDPLRVESERAQRFFEISNALKKEEISLFIYSINSLNKNWDLENDNSEKLESKLKEVKEKIIKNNAQKKEFEILTSEQKKEFEAWENLIRKFYDFGSRLDSIAASFDGLTSSLNTISNMLDLRINDFKQKQSILSSDVFEESKKKNIDYDETEFFLKRMSEKINKISTLIKNFIEKIKSLVSSNNFEIEVYENLINEEIDEALKFLKEKQIEKVRQEAQKIEDRQRIQSKIDDENKRIDDNNNLIANIKKYCEKNITCAHATAELLNRLKTVLNLVKSRFVPEFNNKKADYLKTQETINKLSQEQNRLNIIQSDIDNNLYKSNLNKENIKEKVKDLSLKIYEDYNFSIDYIMRNYKSTENATEARERIRTLKSDLFKYKNVNPNASMEYKRISERFDFLSMQKKDLSATRKNLEKLILEINKRIEAFFREKFETINDNFKYYFKILFPLGEGEMVLVNNEDSEDQFGIDLKVDIGNNKLVSLSLLSGGEKTLVSIAFLFAIFSSKPSPFYIFDEIDAALDDSNLVRFLSLAKEFSADKQIITITHQKRTMEIANIIYGITMQSSGISKIVSEKIKAHEKVS